MLGHNVAFFLLGRKSYLCGNSPAPMRPAF